MKAIASVLSIALITLAFTTAATAAKPDRACTAEVRAAGDWGKNLNPGKATFVSGTPGDDMIPYIAPGVVFCGLGGDDVVEVNDGWFYGGDDIDAVAINNGFVNGGQDTDVVLTNNGEFFGGPDVVRDIVHVNLGLFDGGPGNDLVQANFGLCISVESGCEAGA